MIEVSDTGSSASGRNFRSILLMVGVGVTVALALTYFAYRSMNYRTIMSGLAPEEAAEVVRVLEDREVEYRVTAGGSAIAVPASQADRIRIDIADAHSPERRIVGFEIFDNSEMGLTEFGQKIRHQRALQGDLARTIITMMEPVADARVHVSMPERVLFADDRARPKAAVSIRPAPGASINQSIVQGIQFLVAFSIPELEPTDVVILDQNGMMLSAVPTTGASVAETAVNAVNSIADGADIAAVSDDADGMSLAVDMTVANEPYVNLERMISDDILAPSTEVQASEAATQVSEYLGSMATEEVDTVPLGGTEPARSIWAFYGWIVWSLITSGAFVFALLVVRRMRRPTLSKEEIAAWADRLTDLSQRRVEPGAGL